MVIALLGIAIVVKPTNDAVKWAYRLIGMPTTDASKLAVNKEFKPTDELNQSLKEGDIVSGFPVTSAYGNRDKPNEEASSDHRGVDIGTPVGTPLYVIGKPNPSSSFSGFAEVFCSLPMGDDARGFAAYVKSPDFPNVEFVYYHLKPYSCTSGRLNAGSKFAETGNSGNSTGPHLHFGTRLRGDWTKFDFREEYFDPKRWQVQWTLEGNSPTTTLKSGKSVIERLRGAIAGQESNHNPKAVNTDSGALGYGQVMPENIKSWSTQCLGTPLTEAEFLKDKVKQVKIIDCKLEEALKKVAPTSKSEEEQIRKAASIWYSGDPNLFDNTRPQPYGDNMYPSIAEYTQTVYERFKKQ